MALPTIMVHLTCRKENAELVAETLSEVFEDVGESPLITVSSALSLETCEIVLQTERIYTDQAVDNLISELGSTAIMGLPGVLEADVISSNDAM